MAKQPENQQENTWWSNEDIGEEVTNKRILLKKWERCGNQRKRPGDISEAEQS